MRIAYTTLACPDWTLDEILKTAVDCGYDGVDFRGYKREMAVYKLPEFSSNAPDTMTRFSDAGLVVSAFSSSARMYVADPTERDACIEEVAAYARLCETFGVEYIRVFGGKTDGAPVDEAVASATATLEKMATVAAPTIVTVETHDDWIDSSMLARVFAKVQAENVGILWDLHHPFRMNGESPPQTYDNIGRYVNYTHVKDSRLVEGGKRGCESTLAGEGDVPLAEMIGLLKAGGYDGWLTVEWEKLWNPAIAEPEVALPSYASYLRQFV